MSKSWLKKSGRYDLHLEIWLGLNPSLTRWSKHKGKLWYGSYYVTNLNTPPFRSYVRVLVRSAEIRWSPKIPTAMIVGAKSCGIMPSCFRKDGNWCFECGSIILNQRFSRNKVMYTQVSRFDTSTSVPKRNNVITPPSSNVQLTREIVVPFSTSLLR